MSRRIFVTMDDDALDLLLKLAGGERKQGAYLSELVRRADAMQRQDSALNKQIAEVQTLLAEANDKLTLAQNSTRQ